MTEYLPACKQLVMLFFAQGMGQCGGGLAEHKGDEDFPPHGGMASLAFASSRILLTYGFVFLVVGMPSFVSPCIASCYPSISPEEQAGL